MKKFKNKKTKSLLIIIKILLLTLIESSNIENSGKILTFKINGEITISGTKNNIIETTKLNSPLIYTKINEKNINFKDNNILPTQNGELNYIDIYQHITLLDISLEEFFINSPMIIKKYPHLYFISNRTMNLFALNIKNGSLYNMEYYDNNILIDNRFKYIKEICPLNENDVLFLRIDYFLKMKYTYINGGGIKDNFNDLIWHSHYIKLIPLYPNINIDNNNNYANNNQYGNEDYYIFEVFENKSINVIYSQDKDIFKQIKDIQNDFNYDNYYFGNNKRKHLFEYNIIKKDDKTINLSIKFFKTFILLIIIFVLSAFSLKIYKSKIKNNVSNSHPKITPLIIEKINNDNSYNNNKNNIEQIQENQNKNIISPKSKSISNLSTICSIENEHKQKNKNIENFQLYPLNNNKASYKKLSSSGKKRDFLKHSTSKNSIRRIPRKRRPSIKHIFKIIEKSTDEEKKELKELFTTYISDINKNTNDSFINFNSSENEEKYKKIFSLIKSDDSSSSDEISINGKNQGNYEGELENNFLFFFNNGRLLKTFKDFQFIGKGGFGVVFKATNKIDESQYAIKVMKINLDLKEEKEDLKVIQEIKTMLKFKKKNIVRYKTCWFEFNQKRVKKKRERAMSLEERNSPSIDFNNNFLEKGEKKIKNRLDKHLKTPLERIQSISKELKLAEKQNNVQKNKKRKKSIIWDSDDEESDADSLGANKNYAIKEEGEDNYINLDDDENENDIDDINQKIKKENEENSIENDNIKFHYENENDNDKNENNRKNKKNRNRIIDKSSSYNSKKNNELSNNDDDVESDEDEYEYDALKNKNYFKESSSKNIDNTTSNDINLEKDSENNSIFEEEIRKEKEVLNQQKSKSINENNDLKEGNSDSDDDFKNNNSEDGLGISKQKRKIKNKKYPIYFVIQMEYCSGCPMNYYLSHRKKVPSKKLTTYMLYQMCKAVKHIHEGNIIHRDLKPGNIFIIDDYLIKIGDFGLALNSKSTQYKQGGTYLYQSPEQINNQPYDEKIDIFALGVILVELVSKFNTEFERIETLQGLKKSIYPEYLKEEHLKEYNLVKKLTKLNPKERPNIKDIFKDIDFIDLINESFNVEQI